jgi:hypothetical protein
LGLTATAPGLDPVSQLDPGQGIEVSAPPAPIEKGEIVFDPSFET